MMTRGAKYFRLTLETPQTASARQHHQVGQAVAVGTVQGTGEPAVLVVAYAETRPGLAGLVAQAVAVEDCPDLRVLLLARSAGEWWWW